jgi:hypothetical protein
MLKMLAHVGVYTKGVVNACIDMAEVADVVSDMATQENK